jgi:hypothetical protein
MKQNNNANNERSGALQEVFIEAVGQRVLLLAAQFPFLFIGRLIDVIEDFIRLEVETTHIDQLEGREWLLHLDNINVFYIERDGAPRIPRLNE